MQNVTQATILDDEYARFFPKSARQTADTARSRSKAMIQYLVTRNRTRLKYFLFRRCCEKNLSFRLLFLCDIYSTPPSVNVYVSSRTLAFIIRYLTWLRRAICGKYHLQHPFHERHMEGDENRGQSRLSLLAPLRI